MNEKVGKAHLGAIGAAGSARMLPGGAEVEASNLELQADFFERRGDYARANEIRDAAAKLRGHS